MPNGCLEFDAHNVVTYHTSVSTVTCGTVSAGAAANCVCYHPGTNGRRLGSTDLYDITEWPPVLIYNPNVLTVNAEDLTVVIGGTGTVQATRGAAPNPTGSPASSPLRAAPSTWSLQPDGGRRHGPRLVQLRQRHLQPVAAPSCPADFSRHLRRLVVMATDQPGGTSWTDPGHARGQLYDQTFTATMLASKREARMTCRWLPSRPAAAHVIAGIPGRSTTTGGGGTACARTPRTVW